MTPNMPCVTPGAQVRRLQKKGGIAAATPPNLPGVHPPGADTRAYNILSVGGEGLLCQLTRRGWVEDHRVNLQQDAKFWVA